MGSGLLGFVWVVLLMGRESLSDNFYEKCWTSLTSMPYRLSASAGVYVKFHSGAHGSIFVTGGYDNTGEVQEHVLRYDLDNDQWSAILATLPAPRAAHMSGFVNGKIYVIGGYATVKEPVSTVHVYDIARDNWTTDESASLPLPLFDADVVIRGDKIYVFGGVTAGDKLSKNVFVLDTSTMTWDTETLLPSPRAGSSVVLTDDESEVVVIGGRDDTLPLNDVNRYNFITRTWKTDDQALLHGVVHSQAALVQSRNHLYVAGGSNENNMGQYVTGDYLAMNLKLHEWYIRVKLPTPLTKHIMLQTKDREIIVIGGQRTMGLGAVASDAYRYNGDDCVSTWTDGGLFLMIHGILSAIGVVGYTSFLIYRSRFRNQTPLRWTRTR